MNTHTDYRPYRCKTSGVIAYMCAEHFNGALWLFDGYTYYLASKFSMIQDECCAA